MDGAPVSVGFFSVNASGELSKTSYVFDASILASATAYVLTIEPNPDTNLAPSSVHILGGDFSASSATVSVNHALAIGTDFSDAAGNYVLATPTDGPNTNEKSGVWWLEPLAPGELTAGLTLPTLPSGWKYEGWAVIEGTPVSTGKFTSVTGSDELGVFSGTMAGPPFPGEDFLMSAPTGLEFPTDLSGQKIVLTVEPDPDTKPTPFLFKPLVADVPADPMTFTPLPMTNNAAGSNPTGSVTR